MAARPPSRCTRSCAASAAIEVPREFVFMDRAALGLGSVFIHLKAKVNWHTLFNELIADFDQATLARRQAAILKKHGLPLPVAGA